MRILVVTHYANALSGFRAAAEALDSTNPGWGELSLVNCAAPPDDVAERHLLRAMADADCIMVDLMGCDQRWVELVGEGLEHHDGQFISTGAHFTDRTRLGTHRGGRPSKPGRDMPPAGMPPQHPGASQAPGSMPPAASAAQRPSGMGRPAGMGRPGASEDAATSPDAATHARLVAAYRRMLPGDALHVLATLLHDYGNMPEVQVPDPAQHRPGVYLADPATGERWSDLDAHCHVHGRPAGVPVVAVLYNGQSYPVDKEQVAARLVQALSHDAWVLPIAVETDAAHALERIVEVCTTPGLRPDVLVNLIGFRFGAGPMGGDAAAGEQALASIDATLVSPLILGRHTAAEWQASDRGLEPSDLLVSVMLPEFDGATNQIPIAALPEGCGTRTPEVMGEQLDHLVDRVRGLLRLRHLRNSQKKVALIGYDYPAGEGHLLAASQLDVAASMSAILDDLATQGYDTHPVSPDQLRDDLLATSVNSSSYGRGLPARTYSPRAARADLDDPLVWAEVDAAWPPDGTAVMSDADGNHLVPGMEYGKVLVGVQPGRGDTTPSAAHDNTLPPHPQYLAYYTWLREVWGADVIVHVGTHGTFEFLKSKQSAVGVHDFPDLMLGGVPHVYLYYVGNPAEALVARRRSHAVMVSHQPPVMVPGGLHSEMDELQRLLEEYRRSRDLTPQAADDLRDRIAGHADALHCPTDPEVLETELERLRDQLVPVGLHVFGRPWTPEQVSEMVFVAVLETDDGTALHDRHGGEHVRALVQQGVRGTLDPASGMSSGIAPADDLDRRVVERATDLAHRFSQNLEWDGLHRALDARHVSSRLGGDAVRDPDVLPAGRSLHQFDPRQVPSERATARGIEMAEQLRAAHRAENDGAEPRCVGLVLWGLETTRTHGETYAEVLSLLGVRPRRTMRPGQQRWEIIPTAELTAPRVDVVVTISGFFRDLYAALADDLDDIVAAVSALDEPAEINPVAARTRATREHLVARGMSGADAGQLAHARVFGPAPGLYSTGLSDLVDQGSWEDTDELAEHFLDAAHHVYTRRHHGAPAPGLYREQLNGVELVAQNRSTNEHHVTDLDHYFEFLGGMGAAVSARRGRPVPVLVSDTTGRRVHTGSLADAARMGLHAQLLNPLWTEAMLAHGHQGVGEIQDRTMNLLGLAATTGSIDDWMFDAVFDRYLATDEMLDRLREANPHATAQMTERLGEADERGLWHASDERRAQLREILLDLEADLEGPDE